MNIFLLVWRNSVRKKARFVLTVLSILVAFYLFFILAGVNYALTQNIASNNQYRLNTSHKISLTRSLPIHYQQKIAAIPGVEQVSYVSWFGGFYQDESQQFAMFAVDHKSYFELFDELSISKQQLKHWQATRTGVVIGEGLAKAYGWQVGDKITINSSIWMNKQGVFAWPFTVAAIYQVEQSNISDKQIFFQHAYFDEARAYSRNTVSWFTPKVLANANREMVINAIDRLFDNSAAATRTTSEQVFIKEQVQQFGDMTLVIKVVVAAVFFTLLLIVCNGMMQANRERICESAMMKALGFSSGYLIWQTYLESLLLVTLGALLGCLLAQLTLVYVAELLAEFLPGVTLVSQHYWQVLGLVVFTAIAASLVPSFKLIRLHISKALGAPAL